MNEPLKAMSLRIPPALHVWLKTKAGEEYCSMNTQIIRILNKERKNDDQRRAK